MADVSIHNLSSDTPNPNPPHAPEEIAELRSLLLGFEQSELEELQERLNNPNLHAEDLSRLLPEAIILRSMQDKLLSEAIVPTIEDAIQNSVKKDLNVLSEAIFPVIGPASRKAIATALDTALQSFNEAIEHSLSPQSFKWRLEARQTGKSFAEVVLLRTLLYQVEQVFLIHKETGIVLHYIVKPGTIAQDADLVSAMLTAIQSFIQDSFNVKANDSLETLQFGELTIWIEKSPHAVLAGVIRGHPPKELKFVLQNSLEKIHLKFSKELNSFKGDTSLFEPTKPYLETCLQVQYKKAKKQKYYPVIGLVLTSLLITIGTWTFFSIRDKQRWIAYIEKLNTEPGIVVTKAEKNRGKFFIFGLRDPLARDPITILKEGNIPPEMVNSQWKSYISLDSKIVKIRANNLLKPPKTVVLKFDKNGILYATGIAPKQWIIEARKILQLLPGITKFNEEKLVSAELSQLQASEKQIEKYLLFFKQDKIILKPGQDKALQKLVEEINKLADNAKILNQGIHIQIIEYNPKVKGEQPDIILSKARATLVLSELTSKGLKTNNISVIERGYRDTLFKKYTGKNQSLSHYVSLKVILTNTHTNGNTSP